MLSSWLHSGASGLSLAVDHFKGVRASGRSHSQYDSSDELKAMIREDLVAERVAIEAYTEIINWLGDGDRTTRRMLEQILTVEEEHADDMLDLLSVVNY